MKNDGTNRGNSTPPTKAQGKQQTSPEFCRFSQAVTVHLSHHHNLREGKRLRPRSEARNRLPFPVINQPIVTNDGSGYESSTWITLIGRSEFACVIAENTTSYPLDHEHEKHRENSRKNERNSTRTRGIRGECLLKEERERGWDIKGGTDGRNCRARSLASVIA